MLEGKLRVFSKIVDVGKQVMPAVKDLGNNEQFSGRITQAGGLIALVGIGLELYHQYRENMKTDEEKAFDSLFDIVFTSTQELLKEIAKKYLNGSEITLDETIDRKELLETLYKTFEESIPEGSSISQLPSVVKFRSIIRIQLERSSIEEKGKEFFLRMFDIVITKKSQKSESLGKFYDYREIHQQYNAQTEYLDYLKRTGFVGSLEKKLLPAFYIQHNATIADLESWTAKDDDFYNDSKYTIEKVEDYNDGKYTIEKVEEIIERFLKKRNRLLVIGASFGIGKTSLGRMIAAKYARNFPDNNDYLPVFVSIKEGHGLNNVYEELNLDELLDEIINLRGADEEAKRRKILLILDGLDEYSDNDEEIKKFVNEKIKKEYFSTYPNLKCIVTTRLTIGMPSNLGLPEFGTYVRLLPFNQDQVDDFLTRYDVKLTYGDAISKLGLRKEEITKPLFAWMLAMTYTNSDLRLEFKEEWRNHMRGSLIYMLFFHHIINGKYKSTLSAITWTKLYKDEKKILRKIAALRQINPEGQGLSKSKIEDDLKKFEEQFDLSNLKYVLQSYFYFSRTVQNQIEFDFVHRTFKEYLLAEYYIESLLEDKRYRLNTKMPSQETMYFVNGLLDLLDIANNRKDEYIDKYMFQEDTSLLSSLDYKDKPDAAIDRLIAIASKSVNDERIVFFNVDDNPKENIWREAKIATADFRYLWMHRWISLYVLNKLLPKKEQKEKMLDKLKLARLITYSSNLITPSIRNLVGVNLSQQNLEGADLEGADLEGADLEGANLTNCDLSNANLYDANLQTTDLSNSKLFRTNLERADLRSAILANANLVGSYLIDASLKDTVFRDALLVNSHFLDSDLSDVELSSANLSHAVIIGCKEYDNLQCDRADFNRAIIDNEGLIRYLKEHQANNVPDAITDQEKLNYIRKDLEEKKETKFSTLSM